jgi:hypothetical protein
MVHGFQVEWCMESTWNGWNGAWNPGGMVHGIHMEWFMESMEDLVIFYYEVPIPDGFHGPVHGIHVDYSIPFHGFHSQCPYFSQFSRV